MDNNTEYYNKEISGERALVQVNYPPRQMGPETTLHVLFLSRYSNFFRQLWPNNLSIDYREEVMPAFFHTLTYSRSQPECLILYLGQNFDDFWERKEINVIKYAFQSFLLIGHTQDYIKIASLGSSEPLKMPIDRENEFVTETVALKMSDTRVSIETISSINVLITEIVFVEIITMAFISQLFPKAKFKIKSGLAYNDDFRRLVYVLTRSDFQGRRFAPFMRNFA